MAYLSTLLGKPVTDVKSNRVGRLEDLIASLRGAVPHPMVVALAVRNPGGLRLIPISAVAALIAPAIPLRQRLRDIPYFLLGLGGIGQPAHGYRSTEPFSAHTGHLSGGKRWPVHAAASRRSFPQAPSSM